jgi:DNA-binding XRE family transcriptional regulator
MAYRRRLPSERSRRAQERDEAKYQTAQSRRTRPLKQFSGWTHGDLWSPLRALVGIRISSGKTQAEIAGLMGVSRQMVSRLEGAFSEPIDSPAFREPSLRLTQRYAVALGYELRIAVLDDHGAPVRP